MRWIEKPESDILPPDFQFYPLKLAVDYAERMYVISRGMFEGIMQFDENGGFLGFVGTNKVRLNIADYVWRYFATKERRTHDVVCAKRIFQCRSRSAGVRLCYERRFGDERDNQPTNPSGEDVLKRYGYHDVRGDIQYDMVGEIADRRV